MLERRLDMLLARNDRAERQYSPDGWLASKGSDLLHPCLSLL